MSNRVKVIIGALIAVVVVAAVVIAVAVNSSQAKPVAHHSSTAKPGAEATIKPSTTPTPSPTTSPDTDGSAEMTDGELNGTTDGPIVDTRKYRDLAAAAVLAYATVKPDETQAQRAARLAPYFDSGAKELTEEPQIAKPSQDALKATVTISGNVLVPATPSVVDSSGGMQFDALADYTADYASSGHTTHVQSQGTWKVFFTKDWTGKVKSITEPTNLQ